MKRLYLLVVKQAFESKNSRSMKKLINACFLIATLLAFAVPAWATKYTVLNTNDSGAGSLRQAIIDANAHSGADTINFNIPGDGPHIIKPLTNFPNITDKVFINAYSQNGSTPATSAGVAVINVAIELSYGELLYFAPGADGSQVSGLSIFGNNGDTMIKTYGNTTTKVTNIKISGNYLGIDPLGNLKGFYIAVQTQYADNIQIGGPNPEDRNVISGGISAAIRLSPSIAGSTPISSGNIIQGNYIGTDISGLVAVPNNNGIENCGQEGVQILDNVISGNSTWGITTVQFRETHTPVTNMVIQGNLIGIGSDSITTLSNGTGGIAVQTPSDNVKIGGTAVAEYNIISNIGSDATGINILDDPSITGVQVFANSIYCNDSDGISNTASTAPVIDTAYIDAGNNLIVEGTTADGANVQIYSSSCDVCDTSDPEGKNYLGSVTASGGTFSFSLLNGALYKDYITATSTQNLTSANTSVFSNAKQVQMATDSVCANEMATYTIFSPDPAAIYYSWDVAGGTIVNSNSDSTVVTIDWTGVSGLVEVCASAVAANNCGISCPSCFPVEVLPAPGDVAVSAQSPVCVGDDVVFTITGTAGDTVYYSGDTSGKTVLLANEAIVTITSSVAGTLTLNLDSVVNSNSCVNILSGVFQIVTVNDCEADLQVSKTVNESTPIVGSDVVFTITVQNNGAGNATGVEVSDIIPSGYTYKSDNGSGSYNSSTGVWTIGNLATNATSSLAITATVKSTGIYKNIAEVTGNETDPDLTNNRDSASITITPLDIQVEKTIVGNITSIPVDSFFTYNIAFSVSSLTQPTAYNVYLIDTLDSDLSWEAGDVIGADAFDPATGVVTMNFYSVNSGSTRGRTLKVKFKGCSGGFTADNYFTLYGDNIEGDGGAYPIVSNTVSISSTDKVVLGGDNSVCEGETASVTPTTGGTWSSSDETVATVTDAGEVSGVNAGTTTLTFTDTESGCSKDTSFTVLAVPVINIAPIGSVCENLDPIALYATPLGGTYSGEGVTDGIFDPAAAGEGEHTITYSYTNAAGCISSDNISITVLSAPVNFAITPATQEICSGTAATLSATGDNGASIVWNANIPLPDASGSFNTGTLENKGKMPYDITIMATATTGTCVETATATVTILPLPWVEIVPKSAIVCNYETPNFTLTALVSGTTISWELINDSTGLQEASGSELNRVIIDGTTYPSGTYTLNVTGLKDGCSSGTITTTLTVE